MASGITQGVLEAGRSAGDILEDLKGLYAAVKDLHENLLTIQDAVEEVLEDGLSLRLMLDLVRVVQEDAPELTMLIRNAAGVFKDTWNSRHRARALLPWCDNRNRPSEEAEEVEEAEALTMELEQAAKEVEEATLPLYKVMDNMNPVKSVLLKGKRVQAAEEKLRNVRRSLRAHLHGSVTNFSTLAAYRRSTAQTIPRARQGIYQTRRSRDLSIDVLSEAVETVRRTLEDVTADAAVVSHPVFISRPRGGTVDDTLRHTANAVVTRSEPEGQVLPVSRKPVSAVAVSPDGKLLAAGGKGGNVIIWGMASGKRKHNLRTTSSVTSLAWSPDSTAIAVAKCDNSAILWNIAGGSKLTLQGHAECVECVAWSPDGHRIATASNGGAFEVWNAASGQNLRMIVGHNGKICCVAWSPDSTKIATGSSDKSAAIWNPSTGKCLQAMNTPHSLNRWHLAAITSVAWSPDGKQLLTGSMDATCALWDTTTERRVRTFHGHYQSISSVSWSPDGNIIATASHDNTTILWRVRVGERTRMLQGHLAAVNSVVWSVDGKLVVTGSDDGTARVYRATIT